MALVDRGEGGRLVERQPEDGLARRPDDAPDAALNRRREHVVRRHRVVPEGLAGRLDLRRRDRREVDDRVGAGDDLVALAEVGQVGEDALAVRAAVVDDVDVQDVVAGARRRRTTHRPALPLPPVTTMPHPPPPSARRVSVCNRMTATDATLREWERRTHRRRCADRRGARPADQPGNRPRSVPTMRDIAEAAGVSQSTVSRVLNDVPTRVPIAAETRERVTLAARKLGYRPNPLARGLRGAPTMLLGAVVRDITDPFFAGAVEALSVAAMSHGYNLVLGHAAAGPTTRLALTAVLETRHCDAIVLLGDLQDQPRLFADLADLLVPVVGLWQGSSRWRCRPSTSTTRRASGRPRPPRRAGP